MGDKVNFEYSEEELENYDKPLLLTILEDYGIVVPPTSSRENMITRILAYQESSELEEAILNHDLDKVKKLVADGVNIHYDNDLAFRVAASSGDLPITKYLVDNGANVHVLDDLVLVYVAGNGNIELLKYLIDQGMNVRARDDEALRSAAKRGNVEIVDLLVKRGADPNRALAPAAAYDRLGIVKYILDAGADIHYYDDLALYSAATEGNYEMVKYLVSRGATVSNDQVVTAISHKHKSVANYLDSLL